MEKRGGYRENAGRKPKADEIKLIERLSPLDDIALEALKIGVESGEYNFIKLFFEYRYGKPNQSIDHTSGGEKIQAITGFTIIKDDEPGHKAPSKAD